MSKRTNQESDLGEIKKEEKRKIRIFRVKQSYEVRKGAEVNIRTNLSAEEFQKLMPNPDGGIYSNDLQEKVYENICSGDGFEEYDDDYYEFVAELVDVFDEDGEESKVEANFDWIVDNKERECDLPP